MENEINKTSFSKGINTPVLFDDIIKNVLTVFSNIPSYYFSFLKSNDNNELTIKVRLKRNSDVNNLLSDVYFYITIDYLYPQSTPNIKCFSNFTLPTLFDGRNLLYSILNQNWMKESSVIDIIRALPDFISRILENFNNKSLVYYGDYQIDKVFDMNEFLMNKELNFFKVQQKMRKNKKIFTKNRYVVLTDIYFLLFDPVSENLNCGRLLFWGDIRQIISCKGSEISSDYLYLEWKNMDEKVVVNFELSFLNSSVSEFMNSSSNKIIRLKDNFKIFQEDMNKPVIEDDNQISEEKLSELIKYKEELLQKKFSVNLLRELMNMYQKIIEILSAKNDPQFTLYLDKLHKMLQDKKFDNSLDCYDLEKSNIDIGKYDEKKFKHRNSFRISECTFSTFNASVENPDD